MSQCAITWSHLWQWLIFPIAAILWIILLSLCTGRFSILDNILFICFLYYYFVFFIYYCDYYCYLLLILFYTFLTSSDDNPMHLYHGLLEDFLNLFYLFLVLGVDPNECQVSKNVQLFVFLNIRLSIVRINIVTTAWRSSYFTIFFDIIVCTDLLFFFRFFFSFLPRNFQGSYSHCLALNLTEIPPGTCFRQSFFSLGTVVSPLENLGIISLSLLYLNLRFHHLHCLFVCLFVCLYSAV
jgi:hypothetical protein